MELELKIYKCLCSTETFKINSISADSNDFGEQYDRNPEEAEDYCCDDMRFTTKEPSNDVLKKYKISKKEYYEIAKKLESSLSFGNCGYCL